MKADLRISIKDYRRNKNLKTQPPQISFDLSRRDILKITRRFNAGVCRYREPVPPSRRDSAFFQPVPALKCRAIFNGSCGTGRRGSFWQGRVVCLRSASTRQAALPLFWAAQQRRPTTPII
jgi:hypothetical protein